SGTAITASVPFGTDRNGLQAVFTASANATVKAGATVQTSGTTANDFTSPVTYTVVAEDGSSKDYTVTVSIAANTAKDITAFSFASPAVTASISGTAITASVPFGTDRNGLKAVFTASANATVKIGANTQTSNVTTNDFTSPVTYTVVAEDGSSQNYTVTVSIAPNTAKDITAFSFASPAVTASISGTAITASVPFGTDRNGLKAVFTASANATVKIGANVQTSNVTTNDFTSPVTYTVVAEDGSSQNYTVTISIAPNNAKEITAFSFASPAVTASISDTAITASVPFGTDRNGLKAVFTASANATVKIGANVQTSNVTTNDFTSPVTYTVVAEDGSSQNYTVTISIAPNNAKEITAFSFASPAVTASISDTAITASVPFGTDRNGLKAVFTASANATVKIGANVQTSNVTTNDFTSQVTYTVVAEDGSSQNYTVTVSIAPNTAKDITAFSFASPAVTASISDTAITASVPFGTDRNGLKAVFTASANATVKIGANVQTSNVTTNDFTSQVTYTVVAEDGSSQNYTVTVSVANPVTVTINQKVGQSDPATGTVDFTVVFSTSVTGFDQADVDLTGTTAGGTRTITVTGSGANWEVRVALSGAVTSGVIKASILAGSVQDSFGSVNTVSTSTDDTITIDPEAPTVASFNPANGSTNVSANAMVITFSENVYLGSGNIELWDTDSSSLIENYGVNSAYLSVSGNTVTINSTTTSKNGKTVAVKIPATAFRDAAGNYYTGIANLTTWSFQISNMPLPTPTAGPPTPTPTGY
ncbi:MAG TPA: Ig-like domain-containing protein, partial [Candidatus Rifleibacterium sp.]|nr:Ig-like domain-containing protein [Candidatus Rifleibacterium sp.]